jgi:hypothetical protein
MLAEHLYDCFLIEKVSAFVSSMYALIGHTVAMNTNNSNQSIVLELQRSASRWRLAAVTSTALLVGIGIGGMNSSNSLASNTQLNNAQPATPSDPKAVVDYAATAERIFRFHADGSMTYLRIPRGERTSNGYFNWGDVRIDESRKSQDLPQ